MAATPTSAAQLDPGEGLGVWGVGRSGAEPGGGSCEHSLQGVFTQQTFSGLSCVLVLASGLLGFSSRTQGAPAARSACPAVGPSAAEQWWRWDGGCWVLGAREVPVAEWTEWTQTGGGRIWGTSVFRRGLAQAKVLRQVEHIREPGAVWGLL